MGRQAQSPWLARSARDPYFVNGYENPAREPQFLAWRELLETFKVPAGREVDFATFQKWFERHRQPYRDTDAHQRFEEFRGVIGSQPEGILSRNAYFALGPGNRSSPANGARRSTTCSGVVSGFVQIKS